MDMISISKTYRFFSSKACFECLPSYAKMLAMNERNTYSLFVNALRSSEWVPLMEGTINNDQLVKWAYNGTILFFSWYIILLYQFLSNHIISYHIFPMVVALTRYHEIWEPSRQKLIAPYLDMLNHSSEPNCEIIVDHQGDVYVSALYDIPAGSSLSISYDDPTNPTPLFAKFGFLPSDCSTIFCKAIHLESQIKDLGYDFKDLLFDTNTGEISDKVWDVFLYELLQNNDQGSANEFWIACKTNDEDVKQQYHAYYFEYTLYALKEHVSGILGDVTYLTMNAQNYDVSLHRHIPNIIDHNNLVYDTFMMTASMLEQMG